MKKFLFLMMALMAIIINSTVASPEAKNKGSGNVDEMTAMMPAVNDQNDAVLSSLPEDAYRVAMQMEIVTEMGCANFMTATTAMNETSYAQMSRDKQTQWRQSFSINMIAESAGTVMLNGANELKVWPGLYYIVLEPEELLIV